MRQFYCIYARARDKHVPISLYRYNNQKNFYYYLLINFLSFIIISTYYFFIYLYSLRITFEIKKYLSHSFCRKYITNIYFYVYNILAKAPSINSYNLGFCPDISHAIKRFIEHRDRAHTRYTPVNKDHWRVVVTPLKRKRPHIYISQTLHTFHVRNQQNFIS